jgi:hypothetical protein
MKDMNTMLDFFYNDSDLVCIVTIPDFAGRKQRFCNVSDLKQEKWQRFLRAANANNSNIYLSVYTFTRPERTENAVADSVDRIFLDFDRPGAYEAFRKDYDPTLVINTSQNKYQVFLKLSEPTQKAETKSISKTIANLYNADRTFDLARIFRLPGFRNRKYPSRPLVSISEFNQQITYAPYNLPAELSKPLPSQREKKDIPRYRPHKNNSTATVLQNHSRYDYSHFLRNAPLKQSGEKDYSRADFSYAVYLFSHQNNIQTIKEILQAESPGLSVRKGAGLENYLEKTIERAKMYQHQHYKPYKPYPGR